MKLLIIEDEQQLSNSIVEYLDREDYLCEQAFTFDEAMLKVNLYEYDCILLDLMLPGGNGLDILRRIKQCTPQTGVIIVSTKDSLDDKVEGMRIGATTICPSLSIYPSWGYAYSPCCGEGISRTKTRWKVEESPSTC